MMCQAKPMQLDASGRVLTLILLGISTWLLATPWSTTIQRLTMERFHFGTPTYSAWAAQQVIPAMYSFENRFWCFEGQLPPRNSIDLADATRAGTLNHFPVRILTFADNRQRLLSGGLPTSVVLSSKYRGQQLTTVFRAIPDSAGGYLLQRTEVTGEQP